MTKKIRSYIDYGALSGITIASGANTTNALEAILKISMACRKFPVVNNKGELTFIDKDSTAEEVLSENQTSELSFLNDRESMPSHVVLQGLSSYSFASSRTEIVSKTDMYNDPAWEEYFVLWCPKQDEFYNDVIAIIEPNEPVLSTFIDESGCMNIIRGSSVFEVITAVALGYKQNFSKTYHVISLGGNAPVLNIENLCIYTSAQSTLVRNWLESNYNLFVRCHMQLSGNLQIGIGNRIKTATRYLNANNQTAYWNGFVTGQTSVFDGGFKQDLEGFGEPE